MLERGHRAGAECPAVKDRGVQLVRAFRGETRPLPGVEERRVLHPSDRGFDGVETASSPRQYLVAGAKSDRESVDVRLLHLRGHVLTEDGTGTAVDHHREIGRGCCYLRSSGGWKKDRNEEADACGQTQRKAGHVRGVREELRCPHERPDGWLQ